MNQKKNILDIAKESFVNQGNSILALNDLINDDFEKAVNTINNSSGRVIVSGIGKSAIIGMKIVATLNSTGTPSVFLHAADAVHGDLGNIQPDDVVIFITKSGNTAEIKQVLPLIQNMGNQLIAITGNKSSVLENIFFSITVLSFS